MKEYKEEKVHNYIDFVGMVIKKSDLTQVFPERKTHHESWVVDSSTKERVTIKWKHVTEFMDKTWTIDKSLDKQVKENKIKKEEAKNKKIFQKKFKNIFQLLNLNL